MAGGVKVRTFCATCQNDMYIYWWKLAKMERVFCSNACVAVFNRLKRQVLPNPMEKWLALVDKTPGLGPQGTCWEWLGKVAKGYGVFHWPGERSIGAYVAAYRLFTNDHDLKGFEVCHTCDYSKCVNPAHLYKGTHTTNMRDAFARGRMPLGEARPNSKFTDEEVVKLRARFAAGEKSADLAKEYGVARRTVEKIAKRQRYKHLP